MKTTKSISERLFFLCLVCKKMIWQVLVIELPMELSLQGGMVVITDKGTGCV